MGVKTDEYLLVNGARQFVSVRAAGENLPLLLYLHGGPGDAALPLVRQKNKGLEQTFTVAVWEQRGAGKSYAPFGDHEAVTIDTFVEDLFDIATRLLCRFGQSKLYLVGHSWGSVLGLKFLKAHPELVQAYIGCGQVVNMRESCARAHQFALEQCERASKKGWLKRLRSIDPAYTSPHWMEDLLFVTGLVVRYQGSLYGKTNYAPLVKPFLFSREYSLRDLVNRQRGARQSIRRLWPELMTVNFEGETAFGAPVVFVEGRHDAHVSSSLVWDYYASIETPKEFHWFQQSCHFPQFSEPERYAQLLRALAEQRGSPKISEKG